MTQNICDKCGSVLPESLWNYDNGNRYAIVRYERSMFLFDGPDEIIFDLCPECSRKLRDWLCEKEEAKA